MFGFFLALVFAAGFGYFCGSIPFGFLIGRFNGIDIRRYGSGNVGATNVRRVLGKGWGRFCFIMDFLKGLFPVVFFLWVTDAAAQPAAHAYLPALAGFCTVVGHVWPIWLDFQGGKGVATTIGALLPLALWPVLVAVLGWLVLFYSTRYVSVASLGAAVLLPLGGIVIWRFQPHAITIPTLVVLIGLAALIVLRHQSNIERLLQGKESRFEKKKTKRAT